MTLNGGTVPWPLGPTVAAPLDTGNEDAGPLMIRRSLVPIILAAAGLVFFVSAAVGFAADDPPKLKFKAYAPAITRSVDPTPTPVSPTPTATPEPDHGPIISLSLASASISAASVVEQRDTEIKGGREYFQDPSNPALIAWYPRFGRPGTPSSNAILAAHVNYVNFGITPFVNITSARIDDALYVTMQDGTVFTYTVKSVATIPTSSLNMDAIVFPGLDSQTQRVTLISCGGDFIAAPGGGGEYLSRVILVAERFAP